MDLAKVKVGTLSGKANWSVWKFKVSVLLQGLPDAMEVVEGNLKRPDEPPSSATIEEKAAYTTEKQRFATANSIALVVIMNNLAEYDIQKIMRFSTAHDIWQELHRLFDGTADDKSFDLCSQFNAKPRCPSQLQKRK
uniref:Argininosuccinate lyase n=1 Tax=Lygus hesperus TaxID=30085 RepID=A0A0A9Z787_LYGHE